MARARTIGLHFKCHCLGVLNVSHYNCDCTYIHTYIHSFHTFIPYTQRFLIHDVAQSDGLALQCSDIFESISKVEGCTKMRSKVGLELSCLYYISWSSTRVTRSELHSAAMAKCISNLTKGFEQKLGTDL